MKRSISDTDMLATCEGTISGQKRGEKRDVTQHSELESISPIYQKGAKQTNAPQPSKNAQKLQKGKRAVSRNFMQHSNDELRRAFDALDKDRSGYLDHDEVMAALKELGSPAEDASKVFLRLDTDHDNRISFEEFVVGANTIRGELVQLFHLFDLNNDGSISLSELREGFARLRLSAAPDTIESLFLRADTDRNGTIDFNEFVSLFFLLQPVDLLRHYAEMGDDAQLLADLRGEDLFFLFCFSFTFRKNRRWSAGAEKGDCHVAGRSRAHAHDHGRRERRVCAACGTRALVLNALLKSFPGSANRDNQGSRSELGRLVCGAGGEHDQKRGTDCHVARIACCVSSRNVVFDTAIWAVSSVCCASVCSF